MYRVVKSPLKIDNNNLKNLIFLLNSIIEHIVHRVQTTFLAAKVDHNEPMTENNEVNDYVDLCSPRPHDDNFTEGSEMRN